MDSPADTGPPLKVLVAGGSIGGLTTALFLRDIGCDVEVFERSERDLEGRGAGIVVQPATIWYLMERGRGDIPEITTVSDRLRYLNQDGTVRFEEDRVHRFTSWNALYTTHREALGEERYHLGHAVSDFAAQPDGVTVRFDNGAERWGDLLVGADGSASTVRQKLLPHVTASYAGYMGWRGVVELDMLPTRTRQELAGKLVYCQLEDSQILSYPIPTAPEGAAGHEVVFNWVWYRNVPEGPALDQLLTGADGTIRNSLPPGTVPSHVLEDLLKTAASVLPPAFRELVHATPEPFAQKIQDLGVSQMAFRRVCLLGDAAFTARPHAAIGTAKAAWDGWTLAQELDRLSMDPDTALPAWEERQLYLGQRLLDRNRRMGDRSQFEGTWDPEDTSLRFGM